MTASETSSDPLVAQLLPVVVHEVNNATQLLVGLKAMLEIPGGEALFASRANDLASASTRMADLGFAMAILATAAGADMLMARRDPRSIAILWDLAIKAVQRDTGLDVAVTGAPPRTRPDALDGWQVAWSVASLPVICAGSSGAQAWSWSWRGDGSLRGSSPSAQVIDAERWAPLLERAPGLRLELAPGSIEWIPRPEWLEARDPV